MAEPIRIRVGASADSSLTGVFRPFIEAAKAARKQVEAELNSLSVNIKQKIKVGVDGATEETKRLPAATKKSTDDATKESERWAKNVERLARKAAADAAKLEADKVKAVAKAEADKTRDVEKAEANRLRIRERSATMAGQYASREVDRREREEKRAARAAVATARSEERRQARANRVQQREERAIARNQDRDRMGTMRNVQRGISVASRAASFGLNAGRQVAGDLLAGSGVNTDLGSMFKQGVDLEKQATDLSNSGYMPGAAGANGQRQNAGALVEQARSVATGAGQDPTKVLEGLQGFVSKTGDLETGRGLMADMAKLSRATGASMEDMASAAGDVSNGLGDVPNKSAKVAEVMRAAAAMGKEGAVEIKDLSSQMAKLQAAASQFGGSGEKNMGDMVALAQVTRAKGGASSATQAATSVGSFLNTFSKGARLDAFEAKGIKVRDEGTGKLRSARDIITDSLEATGGDSRQMGKLFADSGARRVTRGFETIYADAGGGKEGVEAVRKAFDDLAQSTMSQKEVNDSFAASMNTTEAKVQVFNNQMSATADEVRANLMPALVSLAPLIVSTASTLAEWSGKLTGKTDQDADQRATQVTQDTDDATITLSRGVSDQHVTSDDMKFAEKALSEEDKEIAKKKARIDAGEKKYENAGWAYKAIPGISEAHDAKLATDKEQLKDMQRQRDETAKLLNDIKNGTLRVHVVNSDEMKPRPALPPNNPGAKGQPGAHVETVHE